MRAMKYFAAFAMPLTVVISFTSEGWLAFTTLMYAFVLVPLLDALLGEDVSNLNAAERELARRDVMYDLILYLTVPVQYATLCWFLYLMKSEPDVGDFAMAGRISAMGLMCGVFGINVAHELGHRTQPFERFLSRAMLLTSLYMHFYIEHNRGHHRNVGTPQDGATARRGEGVYAFWLRSMVQGFISAWEIVRSERARKGVAHWSAGNEMIQYLLIEIGLIAFIYFFGGWSVLWPFLLAALIGILLLESINYIEHYGLARAKVTTNRYEDVQPWHSWNADFVMGRLALFELTRHSDHHWQPSRHYEELDSMPDARQLPAGYPAMLILSLIPPLWFRVMDRQLD